MKTSAPPSDVALAHALRALSNPVRIQMLRYIAQHPGSICNQLVLATGKAQATVSQHLRILRAAGLIEGEIDGQAVCYNLNRERLEWLRGAIHLLPFSP
jgi:ArsR family transcriptional regulator, arsenate/arsenite/antimonite-responsive transcriptional repressor